MQSALLRTNPHTAKPAYISSRFFNSSICFLNSVFSDLLSSSSRPFSSSSLAFPSSSSCISSIIYCIAIQFAQFLGKHIHHLLRIPAHLIYLFIHRAKIGIFLYQIYNHFWIIYAKKGQPCIQLVSDTFIVLVFTKDVKCHKNEFLE